MSKNDKNDAIEVESSKKTYWDKIQEEGSKKMHLISGEQKDVVIWKEKIKEQGFDQWKEKFSYNPPTYEDMLTMRHLINKEGELIKALYPSDKYPTVNLWLEFLNKKQSYINKIINKDTEYYNSSSLEWKAWNDGMKKKEPSEWLKDYEEKLREKVKTIKDLKEWGIKDKFLSPILKTEQDNIESWLALLNREIFILENDSPTNQTKIDELSKKRDEINSYSKTISQRDFNNKIIKDEQDYRIRQTPQWKNWKDNFNQVEGDIEKWKSEFDERIKLEDIFWEREIIAARSLLAQENLMLNAWSVISNGEKDKNYQKEMREFLNLRSEEIENLKPRGFYTRKEEVTHYREYNTMIPAQYFDSEHSPKKLEKMLQYQRRKLSDRREYLTFINAIRRGPIGIIDFVEGLSEIRKNLKFLDEKEKEIPFLETTRTTEWQNWKEAFDKKSFDHWKEEFTKSNISDTEYPNKIQSEKHQIKTYRILLTRKLSVFIYEKQSTERYLKWNEEKSESDYHPGKEIITNQTKKLAELKSRIGDLKNTLEKLEKMEKVLESKKPSIFRRISDTISAPFKKVRGDTNHKNTQKNVTPQTSKQPKENANNVQSVAAQHETQAIVGQLISEHGVKDVTDVVHKQNKLDHKLGEVGKSASPDSLTKA